MTLLPATTYVLRNGQKAYIVGIAPIPAVSMPALGFMTRFAADDWSPGAWCADGTYNPWKKDGVQVEDPYDIVGHWRGED